ncbi:MULTISPECIES: metallophosphoesterase [Pelistega]|nr:MULTISPECIES: metallophosphoesterase [Pelistega]
MFSPELPHNVVLILGGLFAGFSLLIMLTLLSDIVSLIGRIFSIHSLYWSTRKRVVIFLATIVLAIIGVQAAIRVPDVKRVEIPIKNLSQKLDGLTIVQLTDLHISHLFRDAWLNEVVQKTNQLNPDIILITGDFIDGEVSDRWSDIQAYKQLKAKYGVFGIMGNHEYYYHGEKWFKALGELGIEMLANEHRVIYPQGEPFVVAGLTDEAALRFKLPGPAIDKALADRPDNAITVLLAHRPQEVAEHIAKGVSLQLSGHTHGGMIIGFQQLVKFFNGGFVSGLYKVGEGWLYLSNGTGLWNGFPIRLGVPSEITLITLRHQ